MLSFGIGIFPMNGKSRNININPTGTLSVWDLDLCRFYPQGILTT